MWLGNMVSCIKGGTQDPEANFRVQEGCEWVVEKKLNSLYRSPNIVRMIKSRRLRWAGHVARMEEDRSAFKILTSTRTLKILIVRTGSGSYKIMYLVSGLMKSPSLHFRSGL